MEPIAALGVGRGPCRGRYTAPPRVSTPPFRAQDLARGEGRRREKRLGSAASREGGRCLGAPWPVTGRLGRGRLGEVESDPTGSGCCWAALAAGGSWLGGLGRRR